MTKRSLTHNKLVHSALVLFVLDIVFFGSLNTSKVPQVILTAGLIVLVANLYILTYGITSLIRLYGIPIRRKRRLSLYVSLFMGFLIALQSIGELSARDTFVIVLLAIVSYAYVTYEGMAKQKEQNL